MQYLDGRANSLLLKFDYVLLGLDQTFLISADWAISLGESRTLKSRQ